MSKVVIVGSGFVGSSIAFATVIRNVVDEVILIDCNKELAYGEVMDISHGIGNFSTTEIRIGDYEDCRDCDIIVVTAGTNRKVGQTRDDLFENNKKIMDSVMNSIKPYYNNSFVLIVSNPVDHLTEYVAEKGFISMNKLCSSGCWLDTSRWISELSNYLKVSIDRIEAYSLGKHGSSQYLLWEKAFVDGIHIDEFCKKNDITWNEDVKQELYRKVTVMGEEIIARKGKTQFGIATSVSHLIECLKNPEYTVVSVGNMFDSEECLSSLVKMGNYEIKSI